MFDLKKTLDNYPEFVKWRWEITAGTRKVPGRVFSPRVDSFSE